METGEANGGARSTTSLWIAIGVLVLVAAGLWIWKGQAVDRTRDRMEEVSAERVAERTEALLGLAAQSLGLAVREGAIAGDLGRVQSYLDRLVEEPGVERIVYAVGDSVRLSTDRSLTGAALSEVAPAAVALQETRVARLDGGAWRVVVPITGLNERLGTVVLDYRPAETAPVAEGGS
ncbi:MAG TPA: hypothetical protein VM778_10865 [Gemmatimonadota bacterium]|nr:hypothetical protein [Gemmatimonadota bacterium]